jgi:hypothetical protein
MKKVFAVNLMLLAITLLIFSVSYADNAEVLPKGVTRLSLSGRYYFPIDKRYNPDGDTEDVAVDFNTPLNSSVFPALGLVEAGFGMPAGSATIGDSVVSFDYDFTKTTFAVQHGITNRLTVGVSIPYWWIKNNVDSELDASKATIGFNPLFGTPGDPFGSPLIPISLGGTPLVTEDAQQLLGNGVDVDGDGTIDIPGFGYKRFETWSHNGIGDIEVGGRFQYLKAEDWRLAFTGGVRLPTARIDDPDDLVDYGLGNDAYTLLFYFNNDYTGIKNLLLNATLRYEVVLSDKETLRVLDNVNQPLTSNKEEVDRDIGDVFEIEASGKYTFSKGFNASLLYKYGYKTEDDVSGDLGFAYESLETESDYSEHVFIIGLSYSTLPLYMEKKFPVPLNAGLSYRNRFAGSNNLFKSQYVELGLTVFF